MMRKKFEVGKEYRCTGLYGGEYVMKVVRRTDTTISFVYDDDDTTAVHEAEIIVQTSTVYGEDLEELGTVETESAVAWTYRSPYARSAEDVDHGYYFAFDFDSIHTQEEWEAEERKEKTYTDEKIDFTKYEESKKKANVKRELLQLSYGKEFQAWDGKYDDDRQAFCNIYKMLIEALDAIESVDNTLIWIGFNAQYVREEGIMERIRKEFAEIEEIKDMKQLNAEWIPWMNAYRLYDAANPHDEWDYVESMEEAEQYAKENGFGKVVECDADSMHVEQPY